ncbi:MAG: hypothetical protein EOM03_12030 [Clostridia bacterium]|nr:hypothetical protein [Clostridia bacterium]
MTTLAADILSRVRTISMDTDGVFWGLYQAQGWLNEGLDLLVALKPDENTRTAIVDVTAGAMQSIPDTAKLFVRAHRNVGGPAVYVADKQDIEAYSPIWMDATGEWVRHFMFDEKHPRKFWIYPQPTGTAPQLEIACSYAFTPVDIYLADGTENPAPTQTTVDVSVPAALVDYVLGRQYQQQNEAGAQQRAMNHLQSFFTLFGLITEAKLYANPNRPVTPNVAEAKGAK